MFRVAFFALCAVFGVPFIMSTDMRVAGGICGLAGVAALLSGGAIFDRLWPARNSEFSK